MAGLIVGIYLIVAVAVTLVHSRKTRGENGGDSIGIGLLWPPALFLLGLLYLVREVERFGERR